MAESLLSVISETSDPILKDVNEDSVPTDLTVSVSVPSSGHHQQEKSELSSLAEENETALIKRLRSELQFQKLCLARKEADLEKFQADRHQEIELLRKHVHLSSRENEALQRESRVASDRIVELNASHSRLKEENAALEGALTTAKQEATEWAQKWTELNAEYQKLTRSVDRHEFTFEQFQELRISRDRLKEQCELLDKENKAARKASDKWRKKFSNLRNDYENRLQDEILKLRHSIQNQIEMLRSSGTEHLEAKLLEADHRRAKATQEANYWRHEAEELRVKVRELESKSDKTWIQLEQAETIKNELMQRLAGTSSSRARLERELDETKREMQTTIDSLRQDLARQERLSQQAQLQNDSQTKRLREYEEAFLGIHGEDDGMSRWPTLLKVQSQHTSRMTKRVTELETEKQMLLSQQQQLIASLRAVEAELEAKDKLVNNIEDRAPETIRLIRDKDALLRELRSQLNRKDLTLLDYARQIEKLKKTRNQLVADLEGVLRDRTELEAVRRLLEN